MKIVFMGTPDFAVPCLRRLIDDGHEIAAVFSQPDRPKGRGYKLVPPPVKELALERGLTVLQPTKLRDGVVAEMLRKTRPDAAVVVAYGRILPLDVLEAPRLGCINVHASLLPRLRGAAPIQWSIINGDRRTGVTTMHMAEGMDTGDIILQRETDIGESETAGELFARLSQMGAETLSETLGLLEAGGAPRIAQDDSLVTFAPLIGKDMAYLDFTKEPNDLCNLVRGLNPSPMAKMPMGGKLLRVLRARTAEGSGNPGQILDPGRFVVACGSGAVELLTVQPEGKKPMDGGAFIRGLRQPDQADQAEPGPISG